MQRLPLPEWGLEHRRPRPRDPRIFRQAWDVKESSKTLRSVPGNRVL